MSLSRDLLEGEYFQKLALANTGPNQALPLTQEQLVASMRTTLALRPAQDHIWVFGYGSLIWNPLFDFDDRRLVRLHGYRRRFCLRTEISRGTPEQPGLVLGLEPGGSCRGLAFRLSGEQHLDDLRLLWRREMVTGAYRPHWVDLRGENGERFRALAFVMNRGYAAYMGGLSDAETARILAIARGPLGSCAEYLMNTWHSLQEYGITDQHLKKLVAKVTAIQDCPDTDPDADARSVPVPRDAS